MTFIHIWIGYTLFGVTVFSAGFIWAVRARQFSGLARGRHIPLNAAEPIENENKLRTSRLDRYILAFLGVLTAVLLIATLWIGVTH